MPYEIYEFRVGMRDAMDQTTLSAQQLAIRDNLLRLIGPGPARFYEDACRLMADRSLHSTSHLVGHLLREIESALRDVLLTTDKRNESAASSPKKSGDEKHIDEIKVVLKSLGIQHDNRVGQKWLSFPGRDNSRGLARQAHRDALSFRPVSEEFEAIWADMQDVLEHVLERFRARYLIHIEHAERMAGLASPAEKDAIGLKGTIPPGSMASFAFFSACSNPAWLPLLEEHGLMQLPEEAIHHHEGSYSWPQIRYLERLVESNHADIVADFLVGLPPFRNIWLHTDITRIALRLDDTHAAQWAERELLWLQTGANLIGHSGSQIAAIISRIAPFQPDLAIKFAAELLRIFPDPDWDYENEQSRSGDRAKISLPEPQSRCDMHIYSTILSEQIPALIEAAPAKTFKMLCDTLESAIIADSTRGSDSYPVDLTYATHPTIEPNDQNSDFRFSDFIIEAGREALIASLQDNATALETTVAELQARGWHVFHRFAVFAIRRSDKAQDALVDEYLFDTQRIDMASMHHEYYHLLKSAFPRWKTEKQERYLTFLGEQSEEIKKRELEDDGDADRAEIRRQYWQYQLLSAIGDSLQGHWLTMLQEAQKRFDKERIPPDFTSYHWSVSGHRSPLSQDDLAPMPVDDIIRFIATYEWEDDWDKPSPDGLGYEIQKDVAQQPQKYLEGWEKFTAADAPIEYLSRILLGILDAMRSERLIDTEAAIALIQWLSEHPGNTQSLETKDTEVVAWKSIRQYMAWVLRELFTEKAGLSDAQIARSWSLLLPLTDDPSPTLEDESKSNDPSSLALNSIRGSSLHAVMQYAQLRAQKIRKTEDRRINRDDIPEVFRVIEEHLTGKLFSRSTTERAVWGQWLNLLFWIDEDWTQRHLDLLFPNDDRERHLFSAAWKPWLLYSNFRDDTFASLHPVYRRAIINLSTSEDDDKTSLPSRRLVDHLMVAYTKGLLSIADDDLIDLFFQHAPPNLAAHAFEFIGYHLPDEPPFIKTATELWDWRSAQGMTDEESRQFNLWFERINLEPRWALSHLEKALAVPGERWRWGNIFKRLLELYEDHSAECIRCLIVATRENDYSLAATEDDELWQLLKKGLQHPEVTIRAQTEDIVHHLGSLGHFKYRELL